MLLKIAVVSAVLAVVSARTQLTNCLDDNKFCVGLPKKCTGPECYVAYSSISNGTHTEIEIFGRDVLDKTWLAVGYSSDRKMKDDIVIYCIRDDRLDVDNSELAGLGYNVEHNNERIGTVKELRELPKKDRFGLDLQIEAYEKEQGTLYCKFTHKVLPITNKFGQKNIEILMAKGVYIKGGLTYHGKQRSDVGTVDLSGAPKKTKRNSGSSAVALLSSALTLLSAKVLLF